MGSINNHIVMQLDWEDLEEDLKLAEDDDVFVGLDD